MKIKTHKEINKKSGGNKHLGPMGVTTANGAIRIGMLIKSNNALNLTGLELTPRSIRTDTLAKYSKVTKTKTIVVI